MTGCISGFVVFVPPIPILLVFLNLDPFHLIYCVLFNKSHILSESHIFYIIKILACLFFTIPYLYIVAKILFISVYFIALLLSHIRNYCYTLLMVDHRFGHRQLLKCFLYLLIFTRIVDKTISNMMLYFISCGQLLLTILAWMVINCEHILPPFILAGCGICFVGGLLLSLFIFKEAAYVQVLSSNLLRKKRAQFFGFNRLKRKYYLMARWREFKEIKIDFGSCCVIDKNAITLYFQVLTSNLTNLVLLIIPWFINFHPRTLIFKNWI